MTSRLLKVLSLVALAAVFLSSSAGADSVRVTAATDYWFEITDESVFYARTWSVQGYWSDPHLWLYNANNELVAANDDWFGLQSRIEVTVPPGSYRLRAGVCCGNPDAWWQGVAYDLETSRFIVTTTSAQESTTTTEQSTTTTSTTLGAQTTTSTTSTSTSTTTTTSTSVPETSTTLQPTTTTQSPGTSTTVPPSFPTTSETAVSTTTTIAASTTSTSSSTTIAAPSGGDLVSTTVVTATTVDEGSTPSTSTTVPLTAVFDVVDELTSTEIDLLVAELNEADDQTKRLFEDQVNVFDGRFDDYVPAGSTVPVRTRRTLVVLAATSLLAGASMTRRRW